MLKILKNQDYLNSGVIVCEEFRNASSLPIVLHLLATEIENGKKVTLISSKLTEMNYKLICSKAGVRWNANLKFLNLFKPETSFAEPPIEIMEQTSNFLESSAPTSVIFDDLSALENCGASSLGIANLIFKIAKRNNLVFCPFSNFSKSCQILKRRCNIYFELQPIGHGFDKDATTKVTLHSKCIDQKKQTKGFIISGERSAIATWIIME